MTERSWFWAGEVTGDALELAPYDNDEFTDVFRKLTQTDRDFLFPIVHERFSNDASFHFPIEPTIKDTTVNVNEGLAIIDGKVYMLFQSLSFDCSSTGYYRLVLRKEFPAVTPAGVAIGQVVKPVMLYDRSGIDVAPSPTRNDGEMWEVTLAYFYNDGTTLDFFPDGYSYVASSVTGEYGMRGFPHSAICVLGRRGGSAADWSVSGTTRYTIPVARIEVGAVAIGANPQAHTFAEAFSNKPVVILQPYATGSDWSGNNVCVSAISATGFSIRADSIVNLDAVQYIAVGPE